MSNYSFVLFFSIFPLLVILLSGACGGKFQIRWGQIGVWVAGVVMMFVWVFCIEREDAILDFFGALYSRHKRQHGGLLYLKQLYLFAISAIWAIVSIAMIVGSCFGKIKKK